jgi:spermidine synthase
MSGLWFTELHGKSSGITVKVKKVLRSIETKFQKLNVYETEDYGKMLTLDDLVMTTEKDEFIYHEMIVHVPLFSHPCPENVLIIGGGDGGTLREVLKHKTVKNVDMVEIDEEVVKASKDFFPNFAKAFDNPKANLIFDDGIEFVKNKSNIYDIIIVDSTDPINIGEGLFTTEFYTNCKNALKEKGILTNQSESPFHSSEWVKNIFSKLSKAFPIAKLYRAEVPTYPPGIWCFGYCSKSVEPSEHFQKRRFSEYNLKLKYYNEEIHFAAFALPNFVKELIAV